MIEQIKSVDEAVESAECLSIKVFGLGGAGQAIAEQMMHTDEFASAAFAVLNTQRVQLNESAAAERVHLECKILKGLGTGGDPDVGRVAAQEQLSAIEAACEGVDVAFIVAGLGGGAATGAAPILAKAAKDAGALVLGFVTMPFECEGSRREQQARQGLDRLKAVADGVICLPNQKLFKLIDENTSVVDTFKITNNLLVEGLRSFWRLLTRPGLIDVHFSDLCATVRGRRAESYFATEEAEGASRAHKVLDKILAHPMLDGGHALETAGAVLVSLEGGGDLTMAEINRIMKEINARCAKAQVIFGASIDSRMQDRLSCTVVVTRRDPRDDRAEPTSARVGGRAHTATPSSQPDLHTEFITQESVQRPAARLVPPAPTLTPEAQQALMDNNDESGAPQTNAEKRKLGKVRQGMLQLEIVSKGRFDKTEPTIHNGEDLDIPTYIRRGVALN